MAFTMDCDLGVDIEAVRPMPDIEDIARRFFCAEEMADLMALSTAQRDPIAAQAWSLHDLKSAPGYVAALAYQDSPRPLETFKLVNPKQLLEFA
jgi:hypothetical protein